MLQILTVQVRLGWAVFPMSQIRFKHFSNLVEAYFFLCLSTMGKNVNKMIQTAFFT